MISAVVFPLLSLGRAISGDRAANFVSARTFSELVPFPEKEQKRLLQIAHRKAFSKCRLGFLALLYAVLLSASLAAGRTLAKAGIIQDSFWMSTGATMLLIGPGWWGLRRLEVNRIRRFLVSQIEGKPDTIEKPQSGKKV